MLKVVTCGRCFFTLVKTFKRLKHDPASFRNFKRNFVVSDQTHTRQSLEKKAANLIFQLLMNRNSEVTVKDIQEGVENSGILWTDPRLESFRGKILDWEAAEGTPNIDLDGFLDMIPDCDVALMDSSILDGDQILRLLCKIFSKSCAVPNFQLFAEAIGKIYQKVKHNYDGQVADYIPQLAKADPTLWGISLCTADGQRLSFGDADHSFCLQSCVKPFAYAIAVTDYQSTAVHHYMGEEPSGLYFNALHLNEEDKPHNPLINSGAIVTCALIKPQLPLADRFHYVQKTIRNLCGEEHVGFDNTVFLSEKEASFRNYAISYYLMEKGCFPPGTNLEMTMDFYLQLCAITVTCESGAIAAATLANGGVNPFLEPTGRLLRPAAVRNTLSLMHSCGMYDYSGKFAFHVGLPAKSGVAGGLMVVIPNVMGIMCRSPLLDDKGNTVRGVAFCQELVKNFNFHVYDDLHHSIRKSNPRLLKRELTDLETELRKIYRILYIHDDVVG